MKITEIKQRLSISQVLAHYKLVPDKNKRLNCPFHNDKTPSMQVYPETNTVYCFSTNCKLHGKSIDQIDFIMHMDGCSKHKAILKAKELITGTSGNTAPPIQPKPKTNDMKDLHELFQKLRQSLSRSKKALEYAQDRHIYDAKLEIGYNPNGLMPDMRYCLIFPLKDENGKTVSCYGRSIVNNDKSKHYYSKNRKGLYPHYPKKDTKCIVLTESIIDALTVQKHTGYEVLALYGTNGMTGEHLQALQKLEKLEEIVLFMDGDGAGKKATEKYSEQLKNLRPDIKLSTVPTPDGEDPNSLLNGHEPEILTHLIENRQSLFLSNENSNERKRDENTPDNANKSRLDTSNPDFITWQKDKILFTILGGIPLYPADRLKVTLKAQRTDSCHPLHQARQYLDLYNDDILEKYVRKIAERLEIGSTAFHIALAELVQDVENHRKQLIEQQQSKKQAKRQLTANREKKAIDYLTAPNLMERTNGDLGKCGVIGEEINRLVMYLIFTSRLREQPLHIMCLGASGTGKTYLQEKIAELIPDEDKLEITMISENALYYFDRTELKHKLILIEDLDGASDDKVLLAIRELQTKKRLSKTLPIKDSNGKWRSVTIKVEGPICLAGTTTREKLYEDNANRSILIYLDNSYGHKEQIMDYQRKLSAGTVNHKQEEQLKEFFKDMQSVLKPIRVRNPYAEMLKIPETVFKPLRSNAHYLAFIETITFYHQYQREVKTDPETGQKYIESTIEDIQWANYLLKDILLAKSDELSKACRDFFERLKKWLEKQNTVSFYKNQVREAFRMNPHNLKYYIQKLSQYGYIKTVGGNRYKNGLEYEITAADEYTNLSEKIDNAFEIALKKVKDQLNKKNKPDNNDN